MEDGCSSESQWAIDFTSHKNHGRKCLHVNTTSDDSAVRCCSESQQTCSSQDANQKCYGKAKTHAEAEAICDADGKRLCSRDELENDNCCKTGCMYDLLTTWTNEACRGADHVNSNQSLYLDHPFQTDESNYDFGLTTRYQWCGFRSAGKANHVTECEAPKEECPTQCGRPAHTFYGRMFCETINGHRMVDPSKCNFPKGPGPERHCEATKPCLGYDTETPAEMGQNCTTTCGFAGAELQGRLWCHNDPSAHDKLAGKTAAAETLIGVELTTNPADVDTKVTGYKEVPLKDCEYWKLPVPDIPTQACPITPPCVKWVTKKPSELSKTCNAECGFKGNVLQGKVFCQEVESGKKVADSKCGYWKLLKPDVPTETCPATPACVEFKTSKPSEACTTTCSFNGTTLFGDVWCEETVSGTKVTDAKCTHWNQTKPEKLSKKCPATPTCVEWKTHEAPEPCADNCGFKGDVKKGSALCTQVGVLQKIVDDKKCTFWNLQKPSVPLKTCPALPACVEWSTSNSTQTCKTTCGTAATTLKGKSFCKETVSGSTVADSKCSFSGNGASNAGDKPLVPSKSCPKTEICAKWVTVESTVECTSTCGYAGGTFNGSVHCAAQDGAQQVSDSICDFWSLKKPDEPTKTCPAQESCRRFGVETPVEQGQSCPQTCDYPSSTLTGSVTCCKVGPGGDGPLTNCTPSASGDACHDSWANAQVASKPKPPTETCDAAAKCVSFVETSAEPCPTGCGMDAVTNEGTVACHETKSQSLVADAQCFAQNLTKPEVMVLKCDATAACVTPSPTAVPTLATLAPTATPTATPTASPTTAAPTQALWDIEVTTRYQHYNGPSCNEYSDAEFGFKGWWKVGTAAQVGGDCKTMEGTKNNVNTPWATYLPATVSRTTADSLGLITVTMTAWGFESDSDYNSDWKSCKVRSGDDCEEDLVCVKKINTRDSSGQYTCRTNVGHTLEFNYSVKKAN